MRRYKAGKPTFQSYEEDANTSHGISPSVLILVVLALLTIAGTLLLVKGGKRAGNTSTVVNANGANSNQAANTNQAASAVNTNVNTADTNARQSGIEIRKTYTNDEYGSTLQYPSDWKHEYKYLTQDPLQTFPTSIRYSLFTDGEGKYQLTICVKNGGDVGTSCFCVAGDGVLCFLSRRPFTEGRPGGEPPYDKRHNENSACGRRTHDRAALRGRPAIAV